MTPESDHSDLLAVLAAAASGDTAVRAALPGGLPPESQQAKLAGAVNRLLDSFAARSEKAEAERAERISQSEAKFSKAFRSSPAAISIAALPEGRWIEINDAHAKLTGYSREECMNRTSVEMGLVDPAERAKIIQAIREKGAIRDVEIRLRTKSGNMVDTLVSVEEIDLDGRTCALTIQYDITNLKRAEREVRRLNRDLELGRAALEASNKDLESFSYSVAHDLRTPLRSIDGFSKLLIKGNKDRLDEEGKKYLDRITGSVRRMAQLIDDLLALSRVAMTELHRAPTDLSIIAHRVLLNLKEGDPDRKAEFKVAEGITGYGDSQLLSIALENLLGNAWKFTAKRPEARIEFGIVDVGGSPAYFVRDNGAGFDMAYADKLFGVFQRLHSIKEYDGTGIGLATVHRVVTRHGGKVWGEGKVDEGATFYFTLGKEEKSAPPGSAP